MRVYYLLPEDPRGMLLASRTQLSVAPIRMPTMILRAK